MEQTRLRHVTGIVHLYDQKLGYGFITAAKVGDIFIHRSVVEKAGFAQIPEGTVLECSVDKTSQGLRAVAIHSVELPTATPTHHARGNSWTVGSIKHFNRNRGFGFITADEFDEDFFLHARVAKQCRIYDFLAPKQPVRFQWMQGGKGKFVTKLALVR